jgi:hypothetical protein
MISDLIGLKFFLPAFRVTFGFNRMNWTAMPETTINKNGKQQFWENKIRPAKRQLISAPALYTMLAHDEYKPEFCSLVAYPTNFRHYLRAF